MTENVDLKALEKRIFKISSEDGLLDIYFGILIMAMGFSALLLETFPNILGYFLLYLILIGAALTIFILGKKRITAPRIGIVKLSVKTSPTKKKIVIFLSINVTALFIVFLLTLLGLFNWIQIEGNILLLAFGLFLLTLPISLLAFFSNTPRWYIIAILLGPSFFLVELLYPIVGSPLNAFLIFGITGGIVLVMGLVVLINFLRKYPLQKEE